MVAVAVGLLCDICTLCQCIPPTSMQPKLSVITLHGRQRASFTGTADLPAKLVAAIVHILLITSFFLLSFFFFSSSPSSSPSTLSLIPLSSICLYCIAEWIGEFDAHRGGFDCEGDDGVVGSSIISDNGWCHWVNGAI